MSVFYVTSYCHGSTTVLNTSYSESSLHGRVADPGPCGSRSMRAVSANDKHGFGERQQASQRIFKLEAKHAARAQVMAIRVRSSPGRHPGAIPGAMHARLGHTSTVGRGVP